MCCAIVVCSVVLSHGLNLYDRNKISGLLQRPALGKSNKAREDDIAVTFVS